MEKDKIKLYDVFGELLYAVAMADGVIQKEEKDALITLFKNHSWGNEIKFSFEYEEQKNRPVETIYTKVIDFCHNYGPAPEYQEFISAMNIIAEAAEGVDSEEENIINSFSKDLIARFESDIKKLKNRDY